MRHLGELDQAALLFAATSNVAAMRWLLLLGANPGAHDSGGTALLHAACRAGSLQMVRELVRRGVQLDAGDGAGWTALHVASCMGRPDVALCLLQAGAAPQRKNARGHTPADVCSHPPTKDVLLSYAAYAPAGSPRMPSLQRSPEAPESAHAPQGAEPGGPLRFEPCFVPREAALHEPPKQRGGAHVPEEFKQLAISIFNKSPGQGVAFLVASGVVRDYPVEINQFLCASQADPRKFGEYLGEDFPLAHNLRLEMLNSLPLLGTSVVSALQMAFRCLAVPARFLLADRLVRSLAHFWWIQHEEEIKARSEDDSSSVAEGLDKDGTEGEVAGFDLWRNVASDETLHRLMFSTLMLYRWLQAGHTMTLNEWTQMNIGIEAGGADVPIVVQTGVYRALVGGFQFLSDSTTVPKVAPAAVAEGHAFIHYNGRAQVSYNGIHANFTAQPPRLLAARGGVSSTGRSSCANVGDFPASISRDADTEFVEEATWLSLHKWLLFFAPAREPEALKGCQVRGAEAVRDSPPYAVVSLRRAEVRVLDAASRRLVLGRKCADPRPGVRTRKAPAANDEWLDLCLLLADGRFQPMEAPRLQLRFQEASTFEAWAAHLSEACTDSGGPPRILGPRLAVSVKPVALNEEDTDDHSIL